jgi:cytochrome P450
MLTLDPPEHSRLRELVQKHFTRPELEALRPTIEARVDHLVQSLIDREEVEFVSEFAVPLALGVLCGLLGVPAADEIRFRRWTDILVSSTVEDQKLIPSAAEELRSYFIQLDRSSLPAGSVLETLSQARLAGRINDEELAAMSFLLLVAGHETTVNLLSSGLLSIISSESLWSELANGSFQIRPFVNELLRFESPLEMATPRFAMEDVRLGNIRIRAGDTVFVGVAAANRDPRRFAIPHEIHDRVNARMHIGFGHGVHFCLGAPLAILEAESALLCLTRRVSQPSLAVDASTLKWRLGPIMRGLRSLPLRVSPI